MESERVKLSNSFLIEFHDILKTSIDFQLKSDLTPYEEVFLIKTSLQLKYRIIDVAKYISKKNLIMAILKYIKYKING